MDEWLCFDCYIEWSTLLESRVQGLKWLNVLQYSRQSCTRMPIPSHQDWENSSFLLSFFDKGFSEPLHVRLQIRIYRSDNKDTASHKFQKILVGNTSLLTNTLTLDCCFLFSLQDLVSGKKASWAQHLAPVRDEGVLQEKVNYWPKMLWSSALKASHPQETLADLPSNC